MSGYYAYDSTVPCLHRKGFTLANVSRKRTSIPVYIGDVRVGGGGPVVVQSMTTTNTADVNATKGQIQRLADAGCEIVRIAVPDNDAADALPDLLKNTPVPLIADIHFDYRLALSAANAGIHGLRINPGNIGDRDRVKQVVKACKARDIPIRIGVNAGSIPENRHPDGRPKQGEALAEAMVGHAMEHIRILEGEGFESMKISLKAFEIDPMVRAYRMLAPEIPYPLHLGITEAGTPKAGSIRSAIGIGMLLYDGIGDTIRVSLTAEPEEEIPVAFEILKSLDIREKGPVMVSCPSCGRCEIDLFPLVGKVEEYLEHVDEPIKVAVMGCVVNGPGEAKDADIGLAGGKGRGVIFSKGEILETLDEDQFMPHLTAGIERLLQEKRESTSTKSLES